MGTAPSTSGNHTVKLHATGLAGGSTIQGDALWNVTIDPAPAFSVTSFTSDKTTCITGQTVTYTVTFSKTADQIIWSGPGMSDTRTDTNASSASYTFDCSRIAVGSSGSVNATGVINNGAEIARPSQGVAVYHQP